MARSPEQWLPVLTKRLDERSPRVATLRSYVNGNAPLPEMGPNLRASWLAFQKKARTNFGGLACGSMANRIRFTSVRVGSDESSPATLAARRIWRDNRMDVQVADAVWDALTTSAGYLVAGVSDEGLALITSERPELFYAAPDPVRPWRARAAVKAWRDDDEGMDYAIVWAAGARQEFQRPSMHEGYLLRNVWSGESGAWLVASDPQAYEGAPPVSILDRRDGQALIEPHLDVIDRINLGKLQRLVTTAMQAFTQRALKGGPLPEADENGNVIDWSKVFEPAPGALWDLPEGIDVWESQQTDIRPMLEGEKADARDFAAVTNTPISVFLPDGANQTAEGAHNAKDQQIAAAEYEISRYRLAVVGAMVDALRIEGVDLDGQTVDASFANPAHVSLSERYAAAGQAKAAGESWKSIARNILGYTPDQIAQDEMDRAAEQLAAATMAAAMAPSPQQPAPAQARTQDANAVA